MASSYDYNEIQPGASDIDREAWPVMYDPYSDDQGLQEVSTKDSESIDFSGKGTPSKKLKADVKISKQSDNALRLASDGLFVADNHPILSISGSEFIDISTDEPQRPVISLKKSEDESNDLVDDNGLYVHVPVKDIQGSNSVDVSRNGDTWGVDIVLDPNQGNVVLSTANGLKAEIASGTIPEVQGSSTISADKEGNVYTLDTIISSKTDNILKKESDGLYVPDVVIPESFIDSVSSTDTVNLDVDANKNLTAEAKISEESGNALEKKADGLYVEEDYIQGISNSNSVVLSVDNGDLSATAKVSSKGDNQTDPANALEIEQDGLWTPTLYLGPCESSARPSDAITGQYIFDTDLGYCLYRHGGAWVNSTGAIIEGNVEPSGSVVDWMANPMTSYGDLIIGGPSGVPQSLVTGTEGQVLTIVSNTPTWSDPSSGDMHNPMTTAGDLIVGGTNGEPSRLGIGQEGKVLTSISGQLTWKDVEVSRWVDWTAKFQAATRYNSQYEGRPFDTTHSYFMKFWAEESFVPVAVHIACDHQRNNDVYTAFITVGESFNSNTILFSGTVTTTSPSNIPPRVATIPMTQRTSVTKIEKGSIYFVCFGLASGGSTEFFEQKISGSLLNVRVSHGNHTITENPNWTWNDDADAGSMDAMPIIGIEKRRE